MRVEAPTIKINNVEGRIPSKEDWNTRGPREGSPTYSCDNPPQYLGALALSILGIIHWCKRPGAGGCILVSQILEITRC